MLRESKAVGVTGVDGDVDDVVWEWDCTGDVVMCECDIAAFPVLPHMMPDISTKTEGALHVLP